MPSESPYKIGLGTKFLRRAKLIFGFLLFLFIIFTVAGIYQGVVTGEVGRVFLKPFREFADDLKKAKEPLPTLTFFPSPAPTVYPSLPVKKPTPTPQTKTVVPKCIRKNIREGEFASNKCYSPQDYEDLEYYLGRYNSAVFDRDTEEDFIKVTCPGMSEMFQKSCEEHKKKKAEAEANIEKYRSIIQGIIAKGK